MKIGTFKKGTPHAARLLENIDFRTCPEHALKTCVLYEYARESEIVPQMVQALWKVYFDTPESARERSFRVDGRGNIGVCIDWQGEFVTLYVPENFAKCSFLHLLRDGNATPLKVEKQPPCVRLSEQEIRAGYFPLSTWFFVVDASTPDSIILESFTKELRIAKDALVNSLADSWNSSAFVRSLREAPSSSEVTTFASWLKQLGSYRLWNALKEAKTKSVCKAAAAFLEEHGIPSFYKCPGDWTTARTNVEGRLTEWFCEHTLGRRLPVGRDERASLKC